MTPEERAKSVLHFLSEYLVARDMAAQASQYAARSHEMPDLWGKVDAAKQFLGTALVALVTDARKVDE